MNNYKINEKNNFDFQNKIEIKLNENESKYIKNYINNRINHKILLDIKIYEINNNKLILFFEHFKGISLKNFVKNKKISEEDAIKIVKVLFEFFTSYDMINFYNFDINLDNIFVNDYWEVKFADSNIYNLNENDYWEIKNSEDYLYEITNILYYLIYKKEIDDDLDFSAKDISNDLKNFFEKVFNPRYNKRIKLKECLNHKIFKKNKNKNPLKSLNINTFSNKKNKELIK